MKQNDIFEDVKELINVPYISDIKFNKEKAINALSKIDFEKYTAENIKDFMIYVYNKKTGI